MSEPRRLNYQIEHLLSAQDEASLYLGTERRASRDSRQVLIQCMPAPSRAPDKVPALLLREHITTCALHHSSIAQILGGGQHGDHYFIVYEYLPGPDLEELLGRVHLRGVRFPLDVALYITSRLGEALNYAHSLSPRPKAAVDYHGSLSPDKVLLSIGGQVRVRSFGAGPAELAYRCPEQLKASAGSQHADLFSLGSILFEILSGERPFDGASEHEMRESLANCQAPALGTLRSDVPEALERLVARCLAKKPENRYHTAKELNCDLRALMSYRRVLDGSAALRDFLTESFPERSSRRVPQPAAEPQARPWQELGHHLSARLVQLPRSMDPLRSNQIRLIRSQNHHEHDSKLRDPSLDSAAMEANLDG